ncbi:hypothetical protein [Vagococcus lutrae]|uniref:hypothetical protein n=1 Tax=Vagococcus lutrae TaxID=81947 RepID=UPI00200D0D81|nr:hypothetical protein [Vagococcus lutrae]MDT2824174.1 hypothetical protein [Vagococcus lutrae]UQF18317.1 hypothetical protein M2905_06585 [Vagococcus lutrae]
MFKGLHEFRSFDGHAFFKDKVLEVVSTSKWIDNATNEVLGDKVEVVILEDHTDYKQTKSGKPITNKFEKFNVKVADAKNIISGNKVTILNPVCSVYGEFQNGLSVKADGFKVIKEA